MFSSHSLLTHVFKLLASPSDVASATVGRPGTTVGGSQVSQWDRLSFPASATSDSTHDGASSPQDAFTFSHWVKGGLRAAASSNAQASGGVSAEAPSAAAGPRGTAVHGGAISQSHGVAFEALG